MKLELEISEVNLVLQALVQLPFAQVVGIVKKIEDQAKEQLNPKGEENANS